MFAVYAAERIKYLNLDILTQPEAFLRLSWLISIVGFVVFFSYSLFKYRNINPALKYSVSLIAAFMLFVGVFAAVNLLNDASMQSSQADQTLAPRDLTVKQIGPSTAMLEWTTDKATIQIVRYKTSGGIEQVRTEAEAAPDQPATPKHQHTVIVNNLQVGMTYEFVIYDGTTAFSTYQGSKISLTTL